MVTSPFVLGKNSKTISKELNGQLFAEKSLEFQNNPFNRIYFWRQFTFTIDALHFHGKTVAFLRVRC